ncbi:MAG: hypothetical protein ACLRPT_05215 [Akkermansia muciniphila]
MELYRSCLDAGAELVLCPPLALSGVHTGELALRSGFRTQHRAALAYLAREIADVPLLLGAADAEGIRFHLLRNGLSFPRQAVIPPSPHGNERVPVFGIRRTEDEAVFSIAPWGEIPPPHVSATCLLLRTSAHAWHEGLLEQDEEEARLTARETGLPVFTARLAGGEGPFLLPGASSVWSGNGHLLKRLRLFERDFAVISPENPTGTDFPCPPRKTAPACPPQRDGRLHFEKRVWGRLPEFTGKFRFPSVSGTIEGNAALSDSNGVYHLPARHSGRDKGKGSSLRRRGRHWRADGFFP